MGRRGEHTKDELAALALEAATALLEEQGPDRLTTREVAKRIGYTVGSLYFLFRNRDDLVLQLNERTLDELRSRIDGALANIADPRQAILAMGGAYLSFATSHSARWRLIFEHRLPEGSDMPASLQAKVDGFFAKVAAYLAQLAPTQEPSALRRSAQALWGGVHGITVLSISGKLIIAGQNDADALAAELIGLYLDGLTGGG